MRGIRVITTYNCNIMCSHCRYKCSPIKKGFMDVRGFNEKVTRAFDEGYNNYIIIEGGEVLLNPGVLYKYLKGLKVFETDKYIVTNGFWGDLDPYVDILRDLKFRGLKGVVLEYDYFHSVFISIDTIRRAIKKCLMNNMSVKLRALVISGSLEAEEDRRTYEIIKELKKEFSKLEVIFEEVTKDEGYIMPARRKNNEKIILFFPSSPVEISP